MKAVLASVVLVRIVPVVKLKLFSGHTQLKEEESHPPNDPPPARPTRSGEIFIPSLNSKPLLGEVFLGKVIKMNVFKSIPAAGFAGVLSVSGS